MPRKTIIALPNGGSIDMKDVVGVAISDVPFGEITNDLHIFGRNGLNAHIKGTWADNSAIARIISTYLAEEPDAVAPAPIKYYKFNNRLVKIDSITSIEKTYDSIKITIDGVANVINYPDYETTRAEYKKIQELMMA